VELERSRRQFVPSVERVFVNIESVAVHRRFEVADDVLHTRPYEGAVEVVGG